MFITVRNWSDWTLSLAELGSKNITTAHINNLLCQVTWMCILFNIIQQVGFPLINNQNRECFTGLGDFLDTGNFNYPTE